MKAFRVIASLMLASLLAAQSADVPLQPVADPKPILADMQKKMSSLMSVYLEFEQERRLFKFVHGWNAL